jgi:hypothetical protein
MKKTLWLCVGLFVISSTRSFAASQAAVLFLQISPGAKAAGMGETFVAMADDATAVFWNPAGLAFQTGTEVTLMHAKWLPQLVSDMSYEFLAFKRHMPNLGGTLGGNITFLNLGENVYTLETGPEVVGTFHSWDMAASVSYGTQLNKNLGLGVTMRYILSHLSPMGAGAEQGNGIGHSFSVDLGVMYKLWFEPKLVLGANLSNMGPKISYVDAAQADPLPTNLKLGFSYKVMDSEFNKLTVAIETNKELIHSYWSNATTGKKINHDEYQGLTKTEQDGYEYKTDPFYKAIFNSWTDGSISEQMNRLVSSMGLEYVYDNMISLRAGYFYDEDGKRKYPSFGAGLKYSMLHFDFAYVAAEKGHPLSDTMRFSLTFDF